MKEEVLYKDLSYKLVGCFYEVYNNLGSGFKEEIYQKALEVELERQKINFDSNKRLSILYKEKIVGRYEPDFIIEDKILVEIKAIPEMSSSFEKQLYYYLKATKYKIGYLVNFGSKEIDIRRRVFDRIRETQIKRRE